MNMSSCLEPVTSCAADHVVKFTKLSPSVFACCKQSKTGARKGLGTRLVHLACTATVVPFFDQQTDERGMTVLELHIWVCVHVFTCVCMCMSMKGEEEYTRDISISKHMSTLLSLCEH